MKVPALTAGQMDLQAALRARGMHDVADELLLAAARPELQAVQLTGVQSADPPILSAQYPIDHPYAKGKAINLGVTPLGAAGIVTADLVTAGFQWLSVLGRIGNATTPASASADLGLSMCPYEDDGGAWPPGFQASLAADFTFRAASLSGSFAYIGLRYNVAGFDKLITKIQNNNAGPLQGATAVYYLEK